MVMNRLAMSRPTVLFGLLASLSMCQISRAYTPKSKEVKEMVARAVAYLSNDHSKMTIMNQIGAVSLVLLSKLMLLFQPGGW